MMKKRKRGKKKGKPKAAAAASSSSLVDGVSINEEAVVNLISLSKEDNDTNTNNSASLEEDQDNDTDHEQDHDRQSARDVNTPSSTGTDQPLHLASINPDGSIDKAATTTASTGKPVSRVMVKLKTSSKMLESQSDTDRSSPLQQQLSFEKQCEDSGNSVPQLKMYVSRKPGSFKIKSSKVMLGGGGQGGSSVEKSTGGGGRDAVVVEVEDLQKKEVVTPRKEKIYDKQKLDSALSVIKKVMKMDAAEPFNVPVNPEALGIPDYFDIIDTPMDFGTICSNLEKGDKYMNSADVFKDVQYIWDNCFKYNSKGDYILDLMRRVKKNFIKYWTAAGLYTEIPKVTVGAEGINVEDAAASSHGHVKIAQPKKTKKRHGRRHKLDCLCAICVLKRRRREREENARFSIGQIGAADNKLGQEFKQEESSLVGSPCGEDSSSNMGESLDPDAYNEVEGKVQGKVEVTERQLNPAGKLEEVDDDEEEEEEEEDDDEDNAMEIQNQWKAEIPEKSQFGDGSGEEPNQQSRPAVSENVNTIVQIYTQNDALVLQEEETMAVQQNKRKLQEFQEKQEKIKVFKKFYVENPLLLSLCGTLFPVDQRSVWSGPHSLAQHQDSSGNTSSIHAAIETFMK